MNKKEIIKLYGKAAYEKLKSQNRSWQKANPKKVALNNQEANRKGGKYYEGKRRYMQTGFGGLRARLRSIHAGWYRPYKKIIAPDSQLHHQWHPGSADYDGIALVEKDQHMHGVINVIQILEGKITIFTEAALRER